MLVSGLNMIKYDNIPDGMKATTKIRYKDPGSASTLYWADHMLSVHFDHAVNSIAPGQSAVIYEGDDVVAGGIIHSGI
jgi:tRNA-specific 2-thiouridylase